MVDTVKILGALLGGGNMSSGSGAGILKSVLGAAVSGGQQGGGGGLGDLLGSVMKGAQGQQGGGGGLGDLVGSVLGGGGGQSGGGGLGGLLGSVMGGASSSSAAPSGGGLGDLLGGVLGGKPQGGGADLSDLVGSALNQFGQSEKAAQSGGQAVPFEQHSPNMDISEVTDQATMMVRAMINGAKADGRVDKEEQKKILGQLGSVTQDEIDFINDELSKPLDVEGFARSVPAGMENQVYAISLMAIDLDSQAEAKYLNQLSQAMGIQPQTANQIHDQMGAPKLYS